MLAPAATWISESERVYARLMARAVGAGNDQAFATMIASQAAGQGALPPWLGLEPAAYRCLLEYHFPRDWNRPGRTPRFRYGVGPTRDLRRTRPGCPLGSGPQPI